MAVLKKLKSILLSAAISFNAAAAPPPAPPPEDSLWKTEYLDTVIRLHPCRAQDNGAGMCGSIYWVNPDDRKIFDYFADPKDKGAKSGFFDFEALGGDIRGTPQDVSALCGHSPKTDFRRASSTQWLGKMHLRGMGINVSIDATQVGENELKVVSSYGPVKKTEKWVRISPDDKRYPGCAPKTK